MRRAAPIGLFLAAACGAPGDAPRDEATTDELIGGVATADRPEIGFVSLDGLGSCTATLIAADVAITAAHCVDYGSKEGANLGWLGIDAPSGRRSFVVDRYLSLGDELGERDLALVHVATPVPADVAVPATVAADAPAREAAVTIFGYGCLDRGTQEGDWQKRAADAGYQDSKRLCPGDSGGPVTLGADGPIVAINSGYYVGSGRDIFGDPVAHRQWIQDTIAAWGPPAPSACLGGADTRVAAAAPFDGEGAICAGRESWWTIVAEVGQTIVVDASFAHAQGDVDAGLFGPSGAQVAKSDTTTDRESIRHVAAEAGTHWVRIYGYKGAANAVRLRIATE